MYQNCTTNQAVNLGKSFFIIKSGIKLKTHLVRNSCNSNGIFGPFGIGLFINYVTNNTCLVLKRLSWWLSPLRPRIILLLKEYISRKIFGKLVVIAFFRERGKCCSWRNLWKGLFFAFEFVRIEGITFPTRNIFPKMSKLSTFLFENPKLQSDIKACSLRVKE